MEDELRSWFLIPLFFALSSQIACSKIWTVISSLHIGQRCCSIQLEPDSHFIMHSLWNMCRQLGILRISVPFLNSSMQITHSDVPNSSTSLFFLYFNIGISFLYWSSLDSWIFLLISALSWAFILLQFSYIYRRLPADYLDAFSLMISKSFPT